MHGGSPASGIGAPNAGSVAGSLGPKDRVLGGNPERGEPRRQGPEPASRVCPEAPRRATGCSIPEAGDPKRGMAFAGITASDDTARAAARNLRERVQRRPVGPLPLSGVKAPRQMIAATSSAGTPASSAAFMRSRKAASTWSIGFDRSPRGRAPSGSVGAEADSLEVPEDISQPGGDLLGDSFFDGETDDGRAGPQRQPDPRWIAGPVGHRGRRGTVLEIEELDVPGRSRPVFARPAGSRLHGGDVIELLGLGKVWRRYMRSISGCQSC